MNATQPEADIEYSTTAGGQKPRDRPAGRGRNGRARRGRDGPAGGAQRLPRALAWAGAGLLGAAEFCPLLHVRTIAAHPRLVHTVQGGPHHGWALLVIALLAALLTSFAGRTGGRAVCVMVALLGAGALAVTLGVDLPDAHATGLVTTAAGAPTEAQAHAAAGLYLETLGAVALLLAGALAAVPGRSAPRNRETRGLPTARDRGLR